MTQRLAALPAERRARFLARLREQAHAAARRGPTPRGDTGPVPLSHAQESLRFLDRPAPDGAVAGMPLCLRLRGDLDAHVLRSALAAVVARHDALRTVIVEREGGPMQVVVPEVPIELPLIEAEGDDHEQRLAAARALVERRSAAPFDLTRTPVWRAALVRVAPDDHLFLLDVPHVVCDAWSRNVLIRELAECYRSLRDGDAPRLPDLPVQYPDYTVWQRRRLRGGDLDRLAAYWRDKLAGVEVLEFPTDRPRGDTRTFAGGSGSFTVGHQGLKRAGELARKEGASPFDVLVAAFFTLLHRYCGLDDLVIGSPDANRGHDAVSSVIGLFSDMRVLRADVSGDPTFRELVQRVRRVSSEACEQGGLPFDKLVDAVDPVVDPSRSPIFQIVFGVENAATTTGLPGIATSQEAVRTGTSRFDMSWNLTEQAAPGADARLAIEFNTDLFDAESIARFARHYDGLLTTLTAAPDAPLSAAEVLSPADKEFLAEVGKGPMRPIRESTVVQEFEARVEESPDSVAVVVSGVETSYAELNARANRLAALLRERGVEPGTRVGLCLRRNLDLTTAILAVLKTGAAYVPLDTAHPPARVAEIAADAGVRAVIAHAEAGKTVSEVDAPVVTLDDVRGELATMPGHNPPLAAKPGDVAYVIYTSGSTGKPKGVLLEHRGVVNFIDSTRDLFDLTPADRVLGFASVTFDVSVFETFSALLTGARLCLATDDERLSIDRLQALMEQAGITVIDLPPTVMPLLAPEKFTDLRIAFVGGEAFSGELVNRWNPGRRLFNGYGPTECTVTMIVEECPGTWDASPPIGLPMANHVAHVLDRDLRQVPVGVPGELVIGGGGLARGYLNREELTAEKFITDPFGTAPGGRLYRTGDLVKRLADGRLVFLGRIDQQVKIRGLRIELGEVESALTGFDGIGPVSVQAWTDDNGDKHLVGYLTGVTEQQVPAVREHLGTLLPSYMIPAYFVVLDELPLTSSGKVDWRRLPAPDLSRAGEGYSDESLTATERRLLRDVLAPLLRDDRLGVRDDFFLAGGNSLQAVQLMSAINRRFGVEIALGDFFVSPTVAHLAATIDTVRAAQRDDDDPLDALASLSGQDPARTAAPGGDRAPVVMRSSGPAQVILLHPSGGELFCYIPLARALREDIGVAGFAADPRDAAVAPRDAMAATAARIAQALIESGLPTSCCLAGWSYGGVLAFEVARQIEQKTGERPPVVLLDAAYDEDTVPLDEPTVRQRFVHDVARLTGRDGQAVRAVLDDPAAGVADVRETLTGLGVELELTEQELTSRFETFRSSALSMQEYRPPGPYGGPVTVLTASPHIAMEEQWRTVCTGPFRAESVPGDHYTLFTEPALSRVVAAIEETLAS
ncbi:amino acid adenylation domain-containing protein [Streptomyces coeruleorubidus]|uniref:non-ribosomal peptide synthetase n=1 Tax=Streptomyces coeruleorubidus TaxID=116188 RepID=UPI00237EF872|nr:amino acid adenylation domain-containing protein [Streptomyces coeruleorubidus]WDV56930.1 amino acid adenylation domain-containing protein [Streptomyces coeruleorubidus]